MSAPPRSADRRPISVGAVLGAAVLFGTAGTARELGPDDASSISVGAARILIGTVVLWTVVLLERRRRHDGGSAIRPRAQLVLLGGAGVALYTPMFFVAVDRVGVAVGTIATIASGPFFAGAIEGVVWRRPPSSVWLFGTVVTVVGAGLLVVAADSPKGSLDLGGLAAALAAGLGYAVYSITAKRSIDGGMSSTTALAAPFTVGAVVVALLATSSGADWMASSDGMAMALYLGVFATGIAYVLFGIGLRRLTSSTAVTLVLAEPVTAALLASLVLSERIPLLGWFGIGLVAAGLWVVGNDEPPIARRAR